MKIGVIDSGVDMTHKRFSRATLGGITLYQDTDGTITPMALTDDIKGHGTGITGIILSHVPDAGIYVVKPDAHDGKVTEALLAAAIRVLISDAAVKIINISMGIKTNSPSRELKQVCEEAAEKGVIIAASAYYLHDELCYPAHFSTVYGVGQGIVQRKQQFRLLENKLANVLAKGGFQRVPVPGSQFRFGTGTSLATAHFTGIIAQAYLAGSWDTRESLQQWLQQHSSNDVISLTRHDQAVNGETATSRNALSAAEVYKQIKPPFTPEKVAIFPFEDKEMGSVLEFSNMMPYHLALAIGYPRMVKTGTTEDLMQSKNIRYTVAQLKDEEYDLFDTIVIGYFLDTLSDHNTYYGYSLIRECIRRGKNFIVWDKAVVHLIESISADINCTATVHFAGFTERERDLLYNNVDYTALSTPSLCVIGTNKKQGKFTTQLTIKQVLRQQGYEVAHVSTEPQGIILDADIIFPIGYSSTVEIDLRDWNKTLRLAQLLIESVRKPDILITGSQGSIIPLHPVYDADPPNKLSYVKGFYPDGLVCTISPNDSPDFIRRTVEVVTSYVNASVLFYVLTPWEFSFEEGNVGFSKISEAAYEERLAYYGALLPAPVLNIKDDRNHPFILDIIQQYFSKKISYEST